MTKRDTRDDLQDILTTIEMAEQFIANMTFDEFQNDPNPPLVMAEMNPC